MEKVRVGIIGLGNQGTHYMAGLFLPGKIPNGVVTALCDNNPAKVEAMKGRTQGMDVAYFDNYIDMLDSGLCDMVMVVVPHYFHPEMVMECLKRGIHVICDKPPRSAGIPMTRGGSARRPWFSGSSAPSVS